MTHRAIALLLFLPIILTGAACDTGAPPGPSTRDASTRVDAGPDNGSGGYGDTIPGWQDGVQRGDHLYAACHYAPTCAPHPSEIVYEHCEEANGTPFGNACGQRCAVCYQDLRKTIKLDLCSIRGATTSCVASCTDCRERLAW